MSLVIEDRTLLNEGSVRGVFQGKTIEEMRDQLRQISERQDVKDTIRPLNQVAVKFRAGQAEAYFINKNSTDGPYLFTRNGLANLARDILPRHGYPFIQAFLDDTLNDEPDPNSGMRASEKLATLIFNHANRNKADRMLVRTCAMKVNGNSVRVIRSCHSKHYAPYSNLEFVQDVLDNIGSPENYKIAQVKLTDNAMRLRMIDTKDLEKLDVKMPLPMVELWNSEVGLRRVGMISGTFRLVCTNGMGSFTDKSEYTWMHRGSTERIRGQVKDAFENLYTESNSVVAAYRRALDTALNDAMAELDRRVAKPDLSEAQRKRIETALTDPTSNTGTYAGLLDAITLAAQSESSILEQWNMERTAGLMLRQFVHA